MAFPFRCFFVELVLSGVTFGQGSDDMVVEEGSDFTLPCSLYEDLQSDTFNWKKDGQIEVFLYERGLHHNNGRSGQHPQFRGRVTFFEHELERGNASICIRDAQPADSGEYRCLQLGVLKRPIKLVVRKVCEDSSREVATIRWLFAVFVLGASALAGALLVLVLTKRITIHLNKGGRQEGNDPNLFQIQYPACATANT